jgi:TM2 domain-containing membrane protein YozV
VLISAPKSRLTYILLALFLGGLGVHNFYAGYSGKGITQLLLTLFLFWTVVVPIGVWIWIIIEMCTVDSDAYGNRMM